MSALCPAERPPLQRPLMLEGRLRVLLVEDNVFMQSELVRMVGAISGATVVMVAETAQEAVQWLEANPTGWDLAIVDMFLRQGHGFDVLRKCRRACHHQRAVMLSNYGRDFVADYVKAAGADRFFDKSFEMDALVRYCKAMSEELAKSP